MAYRKGFALRLCCLLLALAVAAPAAGAADAFHQFDAEFERDRPVVADPLRPWNRAMFELNDRLYFYVLKPVASIYGALLPEPARIGVRNFFRNLATPVRFSGRVLQYIGRVLRPAPGKEKAKIIDYIDINVDVLVSAARARERVYRKQTGLSGTSHI